MELCKPTIVVIAYNREIALERLLQSLNRADYPSEDIRLVISIDKSDNPKVYSVADSFKWAHGEKTVLKHVENMGLKRHVISCGNMATKYGSVIMLEDDLYVSPSFYSYAANALSFSASDERIAGVSLYNHLLNVHAREPFEAINDGYDNWYFQFASSWGQAFSATQWNEFVKYLDENDGKEISAANVPENVSGWSDKSWLKYYIKYMIENDLYFIYPRVSLTTNFADEGTHADSSSDDLQVPMYYKARSDWRFSSIDESEAVYDAFFENQAVSVAVAKRMNTEPKKVVSDIYAYRSKNIKNIEKAEYIVTTASLPYVIEKSYGMNLRPVDANVLCEQTGNDIFIYNIKKTGEAPKVDISKKLLYNYRAFKAKYGVDIILRRLRRK